MAAKRGKSQARRNSGGDSSLPGWAWMVLGVLLAVVAILVAPKYFKSSGDGFFRPQPNPDAEPATVSGADEEPIADEAAPAPSKGKREPAETPAKKDTDYDFYTLLPGREVPMSDAELAASEKAEAKRAAEREKQARQAAEDADAAATPTPVAPTAAPLPRPVETDTVPSRTPIPASTPKPATATASTPTNTPSATTSTAPTVATTPAAASASADDGTRYLLQAGAFQASGQAEEMKARIAMLGLSARVESASINGNTVYRVRMGPYGTASDLADAKRKLAGGGLQAMAIKVK